MEKLSMHDIEIILGKEFDEIKENSEYWSEDDERSINFELQHNKKWVAVDDLIKGLDKHQRVGVPNCIDKTSLIVELTNQKCNKVK